MKFLALAIAATLASLPNPAEARGLGNRLGNLPAYEYGFLATRAADCGLTQYILSSGKGHEGNPLFGRHPSAVKLWSICAATGLGHAIGISFLQDVDPKAANLAAKLSFGLGAGIVGWNLRIAL